MTRRPACFPLRIYLSSTGKKKMRVTMADRVSETRRPLKLNKEYQKMDLICFPARKSCFMAAQQLIFLLFWSRIVNKEAIKHYDKCHRQCAETANCQECRFMVIFLNKDCSKLTSYRFISQNISPSSMISHHMGTFRNSWKF